MELESRSLTNPRGCHQLYHPSRGTVRGWREGGNPLSFSPIICRLWPRDMQETDRPREHSKSPLEREPWLPQGPAGKRKAHGSRLTAPCGEQTRRRRASGNSWESSAGAGKPPPTPVQVGQPVQPQTMGARFHSHFPLLGAAPEPEGCTSEVHETRGCSLGPPPPPDPGTSRSSLAARCPYPTPGSP